MLRMAIKRSSVRTETTIKSTDRKMTKRKRRRTTKREIMVGETPKIKVHRKKTIRVKAEKIT